MSLNDFYSETDELRASGEKQVTVGENFGQAVQNIYTAIENMVASDWIGFSAETYNQFTNDFKSAMEELGEMISVHGRNDQNSADNFDDADSTIASYMKGQ